MEEYLKRQIALRDIPGICAAVSKNGNREVLSVGTGAGTDRSFDIGSVVKTVIATEIFIRAERGEIELTDDIVRKLSHTSAMRDDGGPLWKPEENIFCYCNRAYEELADSVLGGIISLIKESSLPLSRCYTKNSDNRYVEITDRTKEYISDIWILSDYAEGILGGRYLSIVMRDQMWEPRVLVPNTGEHMACGWFIWDILGRSYYGHEGGADGFRSSFYVCPEDDSYVILLANSSEAPTKRIAEGIICEEYVK